MARVGFWVYACFAWVNTCKMHRLLRQHRENELCFVPADDRRRHGVAWLEE
jgi:hypothetical protein